MSGFHSLRKFLTAVIGFNTTALRNLLKTAETRVGFRDASRSGRGKGKGKDKKSKSKSIKDQYNKQDLSCVPFVPPGTPQREENQVKVDDIPAYRMFRPTIESVKPCEDGNGVDIQLHIGLPIDMQTLQDIIRGTDYKIKDNELMCDSFNEVHFLIENASGDSEGRAETPGAPSIILRSNIHLTTDQLEGLRVTSALAFRKEAHRKKIVRSIATAVKVVLKAQAQGTTPRVPFLVFSEQATAEQRESIQLFLKTVEASTVTLDYVRTVGTPAYQYLLVKAIVNRLHSRGLTVPEIWLHVLRSPNTYLNPSVYVEKQNESDAESDV